MSAAPRVEPGFPATREPLVSIVIPVYEQAEVTARCLASIRDRGGELPYEVVAVDDASGPETAAFLDGVENLVLVRNADNLGFIRSCNRGVEAAQGEFVVLLNNDTEVHEGWLQALLGTFERFPEAGLVGARLLYPDGSLQEAGGLIWSDGSAWNYGNRDPDPNHPRYTYVREADYCSGACLMMRRQRFLELGGFDEHYAPAYYEDVDLAFKVRAEGGKALYQPAATVTHHEGTSSGTDTASGVKRYQVVNAEKFRARWAEALGAQPEPGSSPDRARDRGSPRRVLVIDHYVVQPDTSAGDLRMFRILEILSELGYKVTFLGANLAHDAQYVPPIQQAGVEVLYYPYVTSLDQHLDEADPYDIVLISRPHIAVDLVPVVRRRCPEAAVIFDTVDLHHLREQRQAELGDDPALHERARRTRYLELGLVRDTDATLVVEAGEKEVLEEQVSGATVGVASVIYEPVGCRFPFELRSDLLFIGGFDHPPNRDAAAWLAHEILPLLHQRIPDATLYILGSKPPPEVRALAAERVVVTGFLQDVAAFFHCCRVFVAPIRFGAGVNGKVAHALAYGLPVVTTNLSAAGLGLRDEETALLADDPAAFADAVFRLYRDADLWRRLSVAGLEHLDATHSAAAARRGLRELLRAPALSGQRRNAGA